MKSILLILSLALTIASPPDLAVVRVTYHEASVSEESTIALFGELADVSMKDKSIMIAYKGAVTTMMAKYTKEIKQKKVFFKDGMQLLEYVVAADPTNVEIRYLRLSVQENAPKVVGYKKNLQEDKQFILTHFNAMADIGAKNIIKKYVAQSKIFDAEERARINAY